MNYNNAIISVNSISSLVSHVNGQNENLDDELLDYFQRAKSYDDIQLIIFVKHILDYLEKINLNRVKTSIDEYLNMFGSLENGLLCNELQGFNEEFVKHLVLQDFSNLDNGSGNLSTILIDVAKNFYNDSFCI